VSYEVEGWAWDTSTPDSRSKLILVRLAYLARPPNFVAFASADSLRRDTKLDRKTILKTLHLLEDAGLIRRLDERHGLGGAPAFALLWPGAASAETHPKSGTTSEAASRPKSGTGSRRKVTAEVDRSSTKFGSKSSQISREAVPNTGHTTVSTVSTVERNTRAEAHPQLVTVQQLVDEGVTEEVAIEFIAHRKRKRAPLTPLALKGLKAEAVNAGWTLEQVLGECITQGWQGFKADWFIGRQTPADRKSGIGADWAPGLFLSEGMKRLSAFENGTLPMQVAPGDVIDVDTKMLGDS
jgi:hypothetical protein